MAEEAGADKGEPSNRWGTVRVEDCPQIFPFYVEQYFAIISEYPSMISGSLEQDVHWFTAPGLHVDEEHRKTNRLIVMVDHMTLEVLSAISYELLPDSGVLYVSYMITKPAYRRYGLMKRLFEDMKVDAKEKFPKEFGSGIKAIIAETLAQPDTEHDDYFSSWSSVHKTHAALNKIGFHQACLDYVMFGSRTEDGEMEPPSRDYVLLIHRDSTSLTPSKHPNFAIEFDSFYIEAFTYWSMREQKRMCSDVPGNLGEVTLACLECIPAEKCPVRRKLPFYRTDKLYPDHYG